jgi:hypothetical protein
LSRFFIFWKIISAWYYTALAISRLGCVYCSTNQVPGLFDGRRVCGLLPPAF